MQVNDSDVVLHRAIRQHFQLQNHEDVDFEMFDHLIRKIVSLSHAFTGMETIQNISFDQVNMLLNHEWPSSGSKISKAGAKKDMIKGMLGRGKKKPNPEELWVSPFGSHFPNPHKKDSYSFYHGTFCPESKSYEPKPDDKPLNSEQLLWQALSHRLANDKASCFSPPCSGNFSSR